MPFIKGHQSFNKGKTKENYEGARQRSEKMKENWKDPEFRKKMISPRKIYRTKEFKERVGERSRKSWADPEYRKMMIMAHLFEGKISDGIKNDYDFFTMAQQICDRIGIKDGILYFIEIKQPKRKLEKLTKIQAQFKEFIDSLNSDKIKYIIIKEVKEKKQ